MDNVAYNKNIVKFIHLHRCFRRCAIMYREIREIFCKKFKLWNITIEEKDLFLGNRKVVPHREWILHWVMQQDEKGPYVEYYGINGRRGHLHGRIYDNGEEEELEVLREYIAYSPNIEGDKERSMRAFEEYNKRVMADLKEKGLW